MLPDPSKLLLLVAVAALVDIQIHRDIPKMANLEIGWRVYLEGQVGVVLVGMDILVAPLLLMVERLKLLVPEMNILRAIPDIRELMDTAHLFMVEQEAAAAQAEIIWVVKLLKQHIVIMVDGVCGLH